MQPGNDDRTEIPWTKIAGGVGAAIGLVATAVATYNSSAPQTPAPRPVPVLGETDVNQRLERVEANLRDLAAWQSQHEGYSKTESERLRNGIEQALREIAEVRAQLYRRGSNDGKIIEEHP